VRAERLSDGLTIIGVDLSDQTNEGWRNSLTHMMHSFGRSRGAAIDEQAWSWLTSRMSYLRGDFAELETFSRLMRILEERERQENVANVLFYLAVADRFFGPLIEQLGRVGLTRQLNCWRRIIIEKPFGHNLASVGAECANPQGAF
jgi:glucose-6-phosphate 1-dehydrogenase